MIKLKPILSCMLILLIVTYSFSYISFASLETNVKQIEEEIIDESNLEPEWLNPNNETVDDQSINLARNRGEGRSLLGSYQGLTYYSQADSRWANKLYTSTNNSSQTMKSSGCGPTAAAIVVSSSIGSILPSTMADLFVRNGYRTPNNGTAWSAFPFVANYFAFNNYQYTTSFNDAIDFLRKGYYVIVSCGNGLFTTNGHYVVLIGINGNNLLIYDTYMYHGKFDIPSRKGKVSISGNTIYCTVENFRKYANYRAFWCYSNNRGDNSANSNNGNNSTSSKKYSSGTYQVATKNLPLRIRKGPGTNYKIAGRLSKGSRVSINYTNGNWGHLSNNKGWICLDYCKKVNGNTNQNIKYSSGIYRVATHSLPLRIRKGPSTKYKIIGRLKKGRKVTIDYTQNNWGHLSNNAGWICLDYCVKM
ncbi:MAG: SH3 domain-containing protein [Clostridia bacterium]|nr:SH3 domain-containing protein [Clostridia bacterium]